MRCAALDCVPSLRRCITRLLILIITTTTTHSQVYLQTSLDDEDGHSAKEILHIAPKGGRMVIFDSSILHEVLPSAQRRVALTCWVGGPHSKFEALRPLFLPLAEMGMGGGSGSGGVSGGGVKVSSNVVRSSEENG
jgi:hypothetical protein